MARFHDNYGDTIYINESVDDGLGVVEIEVVDSGVCRAVAVVDAETSRRIRKALKKAEKRARRGV